MLKRIVYRLGKEVLLLMRGLIWGTIIVSLVTIAVLFIRNKGHWRGVFTEDLLVLILEIFCVVCVFLFWSLWKATRDLWKEGPLPSPIILTDAENALENTASYRFELIVASGALFLCIIVACTGAAFWAYRTGSSPILTTQELAEFGSSITIGIELGPAHQMLPPIIPIASGFWVGRNGYAVTCASEIPPNQNDVTILIPMSRYLGDHMTIVGGFTAINALVYRRDDKENVAILHTYRSPFKDMGVSVMGRPEKLAIPELAGKHATSGEQIVRLGFKLTSFETTFDFARGDITGADFDFPGIGRQYPLHLSIPFKSMDCGAPVINDRGVVVGMVESGDSANGSEGGTTALASVNIADLLKKVDLNPQGIKLVIP